MGIENNFEKQKGDIKTNIEEVSYGDFGVALEMLDNNGEKIGEVEIELILEPVEHYYIEKLEIDDGVRGQGYGSELRDVLNSFLEKENQVGVLKNEVANNWNSDIDIRDSFYKDWEELFSDGEDEFLVYNKDLCADCDELKNWYKNGRYI